MALIDENARRESLPGNDEQREQRIRERAYSLWEGAGSPEGQADEHWHRARTLIEDEAQKTTGGA